MAVILLKKEIFTFSLMNQVTLKREFYVRVLTFQ